MSIYRLAYVVVVAVVVIVGATAVLKSIPRESYCGKFPVMGDFGDSSEIVSVVSWDIDCGGLLTISIISPLGVAPC